MNRLSTGKRVWRLWLTCNYLEDARLEAFADLKGEIENEKERRRA